MPWKECNHMESLPLFMGTSALDLLRVGLMARR